MKKCEKLLNQIEDGKFDKDSKSWCDIEAHSKSCPDCAVDMMIMNSTYDAYSKMDDVEYPENLHAIIMEGIEYDFDTETSSTIDSWFDKILEPLQLGFVVVSVFIIFILFSLPSNSQIKHPAFHNNKSIISRSNKNDSAINNKNLEQLDSVSTAEVKEFLARLDRYKKLNPEIENKHHNPIYQPNIRLVNDWKN